METVIIKLDYESTFDEKVVSIDAWYDRHTRLYCIQLLNKDGYQVGNAIWCPDKETKNKEVADLRIEYNI